MVSAFFGDGLHSEITGVDAQALTTLFDDDIAHEHGTILVISELNDPLLVSLDKRPAVHVADVALAFASKQIEATYISSSNLTDQTKERFSGR